MAKLSRRLDRGPTGTGRDRNPDIDAAEIVESFRCRIDLRGASPEAIVRDAERTRQRMPQLAHARYLGVGIGYHYFARAKSAAVAQGDEHVGT